ncbi:MAG: MMPL family transporter [Lachnospiraceae bacterium]
MFSVTVDSSYTAAATADIRTIIGESGAISGGDDDNLGKEIARIMMFVIPLAMLIRFISTPLWVEPLLLLINLGVAILINMGTNIFKAEISSVTYICSSVLQLACSVDYGIFLLDRFAEIRREGVMPFEAMLKAVTSSLTSILSSGLTTVVGFAALIAMRFLIGPEMGIVLSKGIIISLLSTLIFLPCLTLLCCKFIDKTTHRSFMPSFKGTASIISKTCLPLAAVIIVLIAPFRCLN